jgi:hypothetical protein
MKIDPPGDESRTSGDTSEGTSLLLQVEIGVEPDADAAELDEVTALLRQDLLELDVDNVDRPPGGPAPPGTRAVDAAILGSLVVSTGPAVIGAVVRTLEGWLRRRPNRSVKIEIGDDSIELTDASAEDQRRLIESFIARHATPAR